MLIEFEDYFRTVAKDILSTESSDEDVLSLMIILHTQRFHLPSDIKISGCEKYSVIPPLTRRHGAEMIAAVFPKNDNPRNDPVHWYYKYDKRTPFERSEGIPTDWRERVDQMIDRLKKTQYVSDLSEDE